MSHNPMGLHGLLQGQVYLTFIVLNWFGDPVLGIIHVQKNCIFPDLTLLLMTLIKSVIFIF
jgi:hypothetical protein